MKISLALFVEILSLLKNIYRKAKELLVKWPKWFWKRIMLETHLISRLLITITMTLWYLKIFLFNLQVDILELLQVLLEKKCIKTVMNNFGKNEEEMVIKFKVCILFNPAIPFLGIHAPEIITYRGSFLRSWLWR